MPPGTLEQLGMANLQGVNLEEVMANVAASLVSQHHTLPPFIHNLFDRHAQ